MLANRYLTWKDFGLFLQQARRAQGISQERLAERLGCDRTHVWRLEHGQRRPSRVLIQLLQTILEPSPTTIKLLYGFKYLIEYHLEAIDLEEVPDPEFN